MRSIFQINFSKQISTEMSILHLGWRRLRPSVATALRRLVQTESSQLAGDGFGASETAELNRRISRVVNVAIIGAPNAGKSTLINNIVGRKVCAASSKVHTTTNMARAMCVERDTQIIFLDTPGIVTEKEQKRYSLPQSMVEACHKSLRIADVIGVIHDVTAPVARESLHRDVMTMLDQADQTPCFLILNKVDVLKVKKQLLTLIRTLTNGVVGGQQVPGPEVKPPKDPKKPRGYSYFSDVFMVSALKGEGVNDIKEYLISCARPAKLQYKEMEWTDQTPEHLIEEAIRAKFMDFLAQEIPYKLTSELEYFEDVGEKIIISAAVKCPSDRIARLIGGSGGGRLNQIKSHATNDLTSMFKKPVMLELRLYVKQKPKE